MSSRILVWGFCENILSGVVPELKKSYPDLTWIGRTEIGADYSTRALDTGDIPLTSLPKGSDAIYEAVYKHLPRFFNADIRNTAPYFDKTVFDQLNTFNRLFNFCLNLIQKNKISTIAFSCIPHNSSAFILYYIAKELGLKTLVFQTMPYFAGKSAVFTDIDEIEAIHLMPRRSDRDAPLISEDMVRQIKDIPYEMARYTHGKSSAWVGLKEPFKKVHLFKAYGHTLLHKRWSIYHWHQSFNLWLKKRSSYKARKHCLSPSPDLTTPYMYFPLHLQPEMLTAWFAGVYYDQILAVERFAHLLPQGWKLIVKDYPSQTEYQREPEFYERLKAIPNVEVVADIPSLTLIEQAKCVAAIVGSSGVEAICSGKPVVFMGQAWYGTFPGATPYSADLNLEDISREAISPQAVQERFDTIYHTFADVEVEDYYASIEPGFNLEKNQAGIIDILSDLFG